MHDYTDDGDLTMTGFAVKGMVGSYKVIHKYGSMKFPSFRMGQ